jgi:hypothetical protein
MVDESGVIIMEPGAGGGTLAHQLARSGKRVPTRRAPTRPYVQPTQHGSRRAGAARPARRDLRRSESGRGGCP